MDLHIIFGPTGSGKGKLARELHETKGYPLLSVDSRKVYKYANIGTDKDLDMSVAGVDFLEPNQPVSAYIYQTYVYDWLQKNESLLNEKGGLIIYGGTGLYLDAILEGHSLFSERNNEIRKKYENVPVEELQKATKEHAPDAFEKMNESDRKNPRRLIRLIENTSETESQRQAAIEIPQILADMKRIWHVMNKPRAELYELINNRVWQYIELGWLEEIVTLREKYGDDAPALQMMGYRQLVNFMKMNHNWRELVDDKMPQFEAVMSEIQREHRKYAKRQETWGKKYLKN